MNSIQEMVNTQQVEEPYGTKHVMDKIIFPNLATDAECAVPFCESWLLSRPKKQSPGVSNVKAIPDKEGILSCDRYEVGDFFPQTN